MTLREGARVCARCGRRIPKNENAIYSATTGNHYCGPKKRALCASRRRKKKGGGDAA